MLSRTEAERLAAMAHALRSDWPIPSLMTHLADHKTRAYRDVAVALAWIATDPQTKTPARLKEAGPWWKATQAEAATVSVVPTPCGEHPERRAWSCPDCATETVAVDYQRHVRALREQLLETRGERRTLTRGRRP